MYTFPNGKKYIGKTKRKLSRRQGSDWNRYKRCTLLWNAIQKYGVENIETDILFEGDLTDDESSEIERHYIEEYKTNVNRYDNPAFGYNLTDGGEGVSGWTPSPERLAVLQEQMRQNGFNRRGTHLSEETKEKLRNAHLGLKYGPMSDKLKQKIGESIHKTASTPESRAKRSKAKSKPIKVVNLNTLEEIIFDRRMDAADFFGTKPSSITRWINGDRPMPAGYFICNYSPTTTERERP